MHPDRSKDHRDREKGKEREPSVKERKRERERDTDRREREMKKSSAFSPSSRSPRGSPGHASGSGNTKRMISPSAISSSASDQLEKLQKDYKFKSRFQDLPLQSRRDSVPSTSHRSRSRSIDRSKDKGKERGQSHSEMSPAGGHRIVAPEPPKPPPMQPPPPPPPLPAIPKLPSFASGQQSTSAAGAASKGLKDLSMEEQRSAWHERIEYVCFVLVAHWLTRSDAVSCSLPSHRVVTTSNWSRTLFKFASSPILLCSLRCRKKNGLILLPRRRRWSRR